MKAAINHRNSHIPTFPNEAAPAYFEQRLLDGITSVITGMGILAIIVFLFTM